jgi:hypothetical protein
MVPRPAACALVRNKDKLPIFHQTARSGKDAGKIDRRLLRIANKLHWTTSGHTLLPMQYVTNALGLPLTNDKFMAIG